MKLLKTAIGVTVEDPDQMKSTRCANIGRETKIDSYNSGRQRVCPGVVDLEIAKHVNFCVINLVDGRPFDIKVGDVTSDVQTVRNFLYDGRPTDIYVSNMDSASLVVEFVTARYSC